MAKMLKVPTAHCQDGHTDLSCCVDTKALQVIALLAEDRADAAPHMAELCLGYSNMQMAISAACVGSYLVDLLHMRSLAFSPMSAKHPDIFLKACQGRVKS